MDLIKQKNFQIDIGDGNTNGVNVFSGGKQITRTSNDNNRPQLHVYGNLFADQTMSVGGFADFHNRVTFWNPAGQYIAIHGNTIDSNAGSVNLESTVNVQGNLNVQGTIDTDEGFEGQIVRVDKVYADEFNPKTSGNKIILNANINSISLAGNGNAYVCANSGGTIYRSPTPCVLK